MQHQADFTITANNIDASKKLLDRVKSVEVIEHAGFNADQAVIILDDHPNRRIVPPKAGDVLTIALGYANQSKLMDKGQFEIAEYSFNGPTETISLYANRLNWSGGLKSPKQRSWQSTPESPLTLKMVIDTIADEHQLSAQITTKLQPIVLPAIEQTESDLQLMTRLAAQYDATAKVANNQLAFVERGTEQSASGKPLGITTLGKEQLLNWQMLNSQGPSFNSCKAYYYDPITAQRKNVTVGNGEPCFELAFVQANQQSAQWMAQARLKDFQRSKQTLSATCIGQPTLAAGTIVKIKQVRQGIDGSWSLTKVHHKISNQGYDCQFEAEEISAK